MAIDCIARPFSGAVSKLRLSRRRRSKESTAAPAVVTPPAGNGDGGVVVSPKANEFRQVFRFLDANGDKEISADELMAYFAAFGECVSYDEARLIIGELSGGDGLVLGFGEFVRVMELQETEDDRAVLRQAFEVYEVEKGSGCITAAGLRQVFRRLGKTKSIEECEGMIRVYDIDGNGVLDFNEFCKMMT